MNPGSWHRARRLGRAAALAVAVVLPAGCGGAAEQPPAETGAEAVEGSVPALPAAASPAAPASPVSTAGPATPGRPATDTVPAPSGDARWTAGERERPRTTGMTTLAAVRSARHPEFDRVVFEFAGDTLPGYRVRYVDRPVRQCGSGEPVEIAGDGWLAVSLSPSRAHDEQGRATIQDRARSPGLPVLRELRLTCDFEGEVEWVLGVASPNRYRLLELRDPARLVVDVRH